MSTTILVLTLISTSFTVVQQAGTIVQSFKSLHHHTTAVVYRRVLKPVAKGLK